jgi:ABC-type glycerol-3-phosphate transport system substrate-binding protein
MITSPISRRNFLRTTALAGAALSLGTPRALGQASEINMIGWNAPALMDIFARAEKEIGVKINYDVLPAAWSDVMAKITLWGQTGYSGIDILFADDLIGGLWGMNGWAEDLSGTDAWTKNSGDIVENIATLNNAVGGVYRIFFTMGLEPFFYNKTLVPKAPTTWEEMVSMAQGATKAGDGIWGWRPLGGQGHAFNTVLLTLNQAGADLSKLDDPATLQALQYMYDWVQKSKITPPSVISEDNPAVEALAAAGKAGMWWTYDGGLANIIGADQSQVTMDNIGMSRWPKGPSSDIGLVHGWGWLLSKFSQKKDAAKTVLDWLASPAIIKEISLAQSAAPPYRSMFKDADILAKLPQLSLGTGWEDQIRGAKFREPIVSSPQVTQLWNMFDKLGSYILSGEKDPAASQAWAIEEYKAIRG